MKIHIQVARYRSGQIYERVVLRGGVRDGARRTWHRNGQMASQEPYAKGLLHGICRQWSADGRLLGEFSMVHGTGVQQEWHDNGQLKIEVSTVAGKFCGRNRIWLSDGSLISERYYLHGVTVSRAEYLRAMRNDPSLPALQDSTPSKRLRSPSVIQSRSHETCVAAMLERVPRSEARQWFGEAKRSAFPSLGRFRTARSALDFVESLYTAGAQEVVVPDIYRDRKGREYADWLLVRLPRAAKMRQRIRRACGLLKKQTLGAFLPKRDLGESHLFLVLE